MQDSPAVQTRYPAEVVFVLVTLTRALQALRRGYPAFCEARIHESFACLTRSVAAVLTSGLPHCIPRYDLHVAGKILKCDGGIG